MKKNSKLSRFYLGLIFVLMYLPIAVVIVFSFNESKFPVRFTGFSLKWYQEFFSDSAMIEALGNSLFLGVVSCFVSAVIGTLGAVGLSRIHWKTKGILEYISILPLMIPEIILGMVLMAFFYMMNLPFGMLTLLIGHTVFCVPYILMEVKARLAGMDPSLEEAARDLGAGPFRAFWDIILPLINNQYQWHPRQWLQSPPHEDLPLFLSLTITRMIRTTITNKIPPTTKVPITTPPVFGYHL